MKKIALLLALTLTIQASFAYVEEYTTSDIKTLNGTGYSQSTLQVVETARILKQGAEKNYVPFYSTEIYSDNPIVKWYQVAKRYIDPAQDTKILGIKEINYNNDWFPGSPNIFEFKTPNNKYQRYYDKDLKRMEYSGKLVTESNKKTEAMVEETNEIYIAPVEVEIEDL